MPTIKRIEKKKRVYLKNERNSEIAKIYHTSNWTNLREAYIMNHPLCEYCLRLGITKPAEEVHHIKYISSGKDDLEMKDIAYDADNLIALCKEHHHDVHNGKIKL